MYIHVIFHLHLGHYISFEVEDSIILEGLSEDVAIICLEIITNPDNNDRDAMGTIAISDIGNAGVDSMCFEVHGN